MTSTLASRCAYALAAVVWMAPSAEAGNRGELTVTEDLIRREILRLEGDWEASTPKLVGFLGKKFESPHYEMLTHLPTVEFLAVHDGKVDDFAVKCLSTVISLRRVDFERCEIDATCLALLRANRKLRELRFVDTPLSEKAVDGLFRLSQVEQLYLDSINVTDVLIDRVARMSSLKKLVINGRGLTAQHIAKIKAALPNTEISATEDRDVTGND